MGELAARQMNGLHSLSYVVAVVCACVCVFYVDMIL